MPYFDNLDTHTYSIVRTQSETAPSITSINVTDTDTFDDAIGSLYLRDKETSRIIYDGGSSFSTNYSYTPMSTLIANSRVRVKRTDIGDPTYSTTTLLSSSNMNSVFSDFYGYQFQLKAPSSSQFSISLNIVLELLEEISKPDLNIKLGSYYTQDNQWTARFLQILHDGSINHQERSVNATVSVGSGYKTTAGELEDTAYYSHGSDSETGKRKIYVLDLTSVTPNCDGVPEIQRSGSSVSFASYVPSVIATYSDGTHTIVETVPTSESGFAIVTAIDPSRAKDEEKTAVFSYRPNFYATKRNWNFKYKIVDTLQSISLGTQKTDFFTDDDFEFDADEVVPTYASGFGKGTQDIEISVVEPDLTTPGEKTVQVVYQDKDIGQQVQASYTIISHEPVATLECTSGPTKTSYYWGYAPDEAIYSAADNKFDFSGMAFKWTDRNENEVTLTASEVNVFLKSAVDKTASHYYPVWASYTDSNGDYGEIDTGYRIYATPLKVESVSIDSISSTLLDQDVASSKSQQYWNNGVDTFREPTAMSFTLTFNNGETRSCDLDDVDAFYRSGTLSGSIVSSVSDELEEGTSVISLNQYIYFSFNDPNAYSDGYADTIYGRYQVQYIEDGVASVALKTGNSVRIVLGNRITKYTYSPSHTSNNLIFTATYQSGVTKDFNGQGNNTFAFSSNEVLMSEPTSLAVKVNGDDSFKTVSDLTSITFVSPSMVLSVSSDSVLKTEFIDDQDKPNISNVVLSAKFADPNDSDDVCSYTTSFTYGGIDTSASSGATYVAALYEYGDFASQISTSNYGLDGTVALNIISDSSTQVQASLRFRAINPFDDQDEVTLDKVVNSYAITNIVGISLKSAKQEYAVNDVFGVGDDETVFTIRYKDANDIAREIDMTLANAISTVNIYPIVGTKLRSAGTRSVSISSAFNSSVSLTYDISVLPRTVEMGAFGKNFSVYKLKDADINYSQGSVSFYRFYPRDWANENNGVPYVDLGIGTYIIVPSSAVTNGSLNKPLASNFADEYNVVPIGYLENVYGPNDLDNGVSLGCVVLFNDIAPEVAGESNITIKFPCDQSVVAEANGDVPIRDYIDHSHALCLFGHNNSLNRLFVGANSISPNYDFHTLEPNVSNYGAQELEELGDSINGDFTYWSEESQTKYGESGNAILGYSVISESQMMVFKSHSDKDARFYIRTPVLTSMRDYSGNLVRDIDGNVLPQEEYTIAQSNSMMNAVSDLAILTFNGDVLFLDEENEIAGLDIKGISGNNQRVGSTRSFYIDKALHEADLKNAILWSCGRLLYFSVPKVGTFVSDRESLNNGQYEWWLESYPDASCYMEWNGIPHEGDVNGKLYRLKNDCYEDEERTFASNILVSVNQRVEDDTILYTSTDITNELNDGYLHTFRPTYGEKDGENDKMLFVYRRSASISYDEDDLEAALYPADIVVSGNVLYVKKVEAAKYEINSSFTYYIAQYPGYAYVEADEGMYEAADGYQRMTWGNEYGNAFYLEPVDLDEDDYSAYSTYKMYFLNSAGERVYCNLTNLKRASLVRRLVDKETYIGSVGSGTFKLYDDEERTRLVDLVLYTEAYTTSSFSARITHRKPIESRFITAPFLWSSMAYGKTFKRIDILNEGKKESDMQITFLSADSPTTAFSIGPSISKVFDFGEFSFESVDFTNRNTPNCYKRYLMFRDRKYLQLAIKSEDAKRSELPSMTILYSVPNMSHGSE